MAENKTRPSGVSVTAFMASISDRGMRADHGFELFRVDVHAATNDQLFLAVHNGKIIVFVLLAAVLVSLFSGLFFLPTLFMLHYSSIFGLFDEQAAVTTWPSTAPTSYAACRTSSTPGPDLHSA